MSTRIGLTFRRLPDLELLHRGIAHIRLFCTVQFETPAKDVFIQPAIVDTGAPLCLVPSDLWERVRTQQFETTRIGGLLARKECAVPARVGILAMTLLDPQGHSKRLTVRAFLAQTTKAQKGRNLSTSDFDSPVLRLGGFSRLCGDASTLTSTGSWTAWHNLSILLTMDEWTLPGSDLIRVGLEDLTRGIESPQALLVAIGAPRLRRVGVPVPDHPFTSPELRLYHVRCHFDEMEPLLYRYPAIDPRSFRQALEQILGG